MPEMTHAQQSQVYSVLAEAAKAGNLDLEVPDIVSSLLASATVQQGGFSELRVTIRDELRALREANAKENTNLTNAIGAMGRQLSEESSQGRRQNMITSLVVTVLAMGINAAMIGIGISVGFGQVQVQTSPSSINLPIPLPTPVPLSVPVEVPDGDDMNDFEDAAGAPDPDTNALDDNVETPL